MLTYTNNTHFVINDNSIKNCVITGCTVTINIESINMKFGDINVTIEDTSSRKNNRKPECISNSSYTSEELNARMRFFKANSP